MATAPNILYMKSPNALKNDPHAPATRPGASLTNRQLLVGLVLAGTGALGFAGKAIIVKLAYRYDVDAVTLIMYRMLFAVPFFMIMTWWAGRGKPPLTRRDWLGVLGLGFCGYYLSSMLDFVGLQYITASLERLILYLTPTMVLALGWVLKGRRIGIPEITAALVSYAGALLVFGVELRIAPGAGTAFGAALVLVSCFTYAIYLFYSGEFVKRLGALRLAGLATGVASACCIIQFLLLRPLSAAWVAPEVIWLSLINGTLCTAAPVLLVMMGVERLGPDLAAQVGMIGPLATIGMGIAFLGEPFTPSLAAGTILVMAGIYMFSRTRR